jgi:16S rRNA (guanine527-N7)-methyltransferase
MATFESLLSPRLEEPDLGRLVHYAELLERWSARHNLVRVVSREELVTRHIFDALTAAPFFPERGELLDVGSGAGLPGVPLLAVLPRWKGTLLEPRQKRWAFLRLVIRELGLEAEAVRDRYQDLSPGRRWDRITARAVGGNRALLQWAAGHVRPGGQVVFWTTEEGEMRLSGERGWRVLSSPVPGLERGRLCRLQPCFT